MARRCRPMALRRASARPTPLFPSATGAATWPAIHAHTPETRAAAGRRPGPAPALTGRGAVIGHPAVALGVVLTSRNEHGPLARAALEAGRHVLVEKPMATSLAEAAGLVELATTSPGHLLPAPHILLSPTYRAIHARVQAGDIGPVVSARAPDGWSRPHLAARV